MNISSYDAKTKGMVNFQNILVAVFFMAIICLLKELLNIHMQFLVCIL